MTTLSEREHIFELEFAHKQDVRFKKNSYRNLLVGRWAAQEMGLTGTEADIYIDEIGSLGLLSGDEKTIVDRISADLQAKGVSKTVAEVRAAFEASAATAEKLG